MRIRDVHITPVAFRDPPLLNTVGVHEPFALRAIVEVVAEDGLYGLGETYGDAKHLARLRTAAEALTGVDVWHVQEMARRVRATLDDGAGGHGMSGMVTGSPQAWSCRHHGQVGVAVTTTALTTADGVFVQLAATAV